jgi:putative ABC transport system permease protein
MHANRNKKAVKRVEKGMMKANRIRNLFAVFAIVLTTFMITTVFSLGINYMENMKLMQVRTAGTTANASLAMPTEKQEQQIKNLEYVKTVGTQYMVGSVAEKNDEGRDLSIALSYYDTTEWDKHYKETIKDIEGKYPSNENEIMLSKDALSQLGMKEPKLNMEIPLSYYDKNGQQEKNFTLSGWFHSYTGTGMGFVSEAYCKNAGYTMAEDGVLSLSLNKMPDDFYRIQKDVELNENQSFGGAVSMKSSSGSVIAMVILLVFFIIGSGYLLIYNVLYISISNDTRFYGLMKTLGTTQKQIKSLVKNQAVKFACIGIPIGILLATAVSFGIVPFVLNEGFEQGKSMMDAEVFFHPSIYILSVIFSAVTVWIACNAPAKAAAKISPIEALKFQNFAPKKTKSRNYKYRMFVDGENAFCIQPGVPLKTGNTLKKASSDTWNALSANQKKAVGLALLYGYQGNRNNLSGSDDEKWLATQTLVWEFVTGCREATGSYNQTSTTVYSLHFASSRLSSV